MTRVRLEALAKLNLYLRVLRRRPDGYHELETLFERIDLADTLTFEPHPTSLTLTCADPLLSCGEDNLVLKAARLLQRVTGTRRGARMHLVKRIPVAAGLGGGSSDAAAALRGLTRLWNLRLSHRRLVTLAARLGSDVPVFLAPAPLAIGRGRGHRCEPVRLPAGGLQRLWHVVIVPPERLSTNAVYAGFDRRLPVRTRESRLTAPPPSIRMALHALRNGSLGELATGLFNDLEPEAIRRCPVIRTIHECLRSSGCLASLVSGSGSAVFGLCRSAAHARTVARRCRSRGRSTWTIHVAATQTMA